MPQVSSDRTAAKNGKEFTGGLAYVTAWADVEKAEQAAREIVNAGEQQGTTAQGVETGAVVPEPASAEAQQEIPVSSQ